MDQALSTGSPAEPDGAPRIALLDILRGIAILGILFMNINDMGGSMYASFTDIRHLGWTQADQIAWWLREVFANGTARCLLEMLFGAGMVILTTRIADTIESRWAVMRRYYARNLILFAFGLAHIFLLLWPGDILHTYGLAALVAFLFRGLRPRWLILIGLSLTLMQLVGGGTSTYSRQGRIATYDRLHATQAAHQPLSAADAKTLKELDQRTAKNKKQKAEDAATMAEEDKARTGTFATWAAFQWKAIIEMEKMGLELNWIWEASSVMLIGAALFKLGILQGQRTRRFYLGLMLAGYAIGVPLRTWSGMAQVRFDDYPSFSYPTYELARLTMTLGHIGLINLLATTAMGAVLLRPFVAAGRTALTIYICQTLITLWLLFPPFGLALYGQWGWAKLMLAAAAINLVLLALANWYVTRFQIAPVEWAWRSLVERRALPWRKRAT